MESPAYIRSLPTEEAFSVRSRSPPERLPNGSVVSLPYIANSRLRRSAAARRGPTSTRLSTQLDRRSRETLRAEHHSLLCPAFGMLRLLMSMSADALLRQVAGGSAVQRSC